MHCKTTTTIAFVLALAVIPTALLGLVRPLAFIAMTRRIRSTALHYFTLIELLVVVAVLAILMSLMYPSLRRAIKEAREVVCMNSIHQLSLAAINYSEDYYGNYPPPVSWRYINSNYDYKLHPHDLKEEDIWHIAPYIGINPSQLDLTGARRMTEAQYPAVIRCPFSKFDPGGPVTFNNTYYNVMPPGGIYFYPMGYAYFGSLTGPFLLGPKPRLAYQVAPGFERKFASRNCDPDAALWGDSVSFSQWNNPTPAGFVHTVSGGDTKFWHDVNFVDFERQNLGYVDGSVKIRWSEDVQPNVNYIGRGSGDTTYCWWF